MGIQADSERAPCSGGKRKFLYSNHARNLETEDRPVVPGGGGALVPASVRCYITEDPSLVPPAIEDEVLRIRGGTIGVGIARGTSDGFPRGAYWVTIMFR